MIIYYNDEFCGGRAESRRLLEAAFAKHTGDAALAGRLISQVKTGDRGKPYIDGFCRFSVSHTGSLWAVLIAERECGLDIQFERKCDMQAIAARVFAAEDREEMTTDCELPEQDVFFRIWTRREALAKALGGSAFDSELPPVIPGRAVVGPAEYMICDFPLEEILRKQSVRVQAGKLYAAVCLKADTADSEVPSGEWKAEVRRI